MEAIATGPGASGLRHYPIALLPGEGRALMPCLSGLNMLFWREISCPLLPELSFPELTAASAFSFDTGSRGHGLQHETRQFCSVRQQLWADTRAPFCLGPFLGWRELTGVQERPRSLSTGLFVWRTVGRAHPSTRGFLFDFLALTSEASVLGEAVDRGPGPGHWGLSEEILGLLFTPEEAR